MPLQLDFTAPIAPQLLQATVDGELDLSYNKLGNQTIEKLIMVFSVLPVGVTSLNLKNNLLGFQYELADALAAIPSGVTSLNLSNNNLCSYSVTRDVVRALSAIPANVTSLEFSGNDVGCRDIKEIVETIKAIPATVTSLGLGQNYIENYHRVRELDAIFEAIPAGVTSLDLHKNDIYFNRGREGSKNFAEALAALSVNVTSLNLADNYLCSSLNELTQIFYAIPEHIKKITFGEHDTYKFDNYSTEEIIDLCRILKHVTHLDFTGRSSEKTELMGHCIRGWYDPAFQQLLEIKGSSSTPLPEALALEIITSLTSVSNAEMKSLIASAPKDKPGNLFFSPPEEKTSSDNGSVAENDAIPGLARRELEKFADDNPYALLSMNP